MINEWIINDADFGKVKDIYTRGNALKQFLNDVILVHPNYRILLQNLSDIYVLVANIDSQKYIKKGEKSWKEIMNDEQYNILETNEDLIIAYMLIKEPHKDIHYIELFDTIVRNNNLGHYMIDRYEKQKNYNVKLIPQNIIKTSAKYWAKILNVVDDKGVVQIDLIDDFIVNCDINPKELEWDNLYYLCHNNNDDDDDDDDDNNVIM